MEFSGMFKKTFQDTMIIPVHSVERSNHKETWNKLFYVYLNKVQKKKSSNKWILHQFLQGFFY